MNIMRRHTSWTPAIFAVASAFIVPRLIDIADLIHVPISTFIALSSRVEVEAAVQTLDRKIFLDRMIFVQMDDRLKLATRRAREAQQSDHLGTLLNHKIPAPIPSPTVEVTATEGRRLYVGNLSWATTEAE
jgi:hypothetical protein